MVCKLVLTTNGLLTVDYQDNLKVIFEKFFKQSDSDLMSTGSNNNMTLRNIYVICLHFTKVLVCDRLVIKKTALGNNLVLIKLNVTLKKEIALYHRVE